MAIIFHLVHISTNKDDKKQQLQQQTSKTNKKDQKFYTIYNQIKIICYCSVVDTQTHSKQFIPFFLLNCTMVYIQILEIQIKMQHWVENEKK